MFNKEYKNKFTFDVETTGLNFYKDKPIQFAGLLNNKELDRLIKWNSIKEITPFITELTGIDINDIVSRGVDSEFIMTKIKNALEKSDLIIGYNLLFDITSVVRSINVYYPDFSIDDIKSDYIDVLAIVRDLYENPKKSGSHKLENVCNRLELKPEGGNWHDAIVDVRMTYKLLERLSEDVDVNKYINEFGYYDFFPIDPNYIIPKKCNLTAQKSGLKEILKKKNR